jgi:hypothetical protein
MKSCLNHVSFMAGCKRCEALNALPAPPAPAPVPEPEEDEEDE